MLSRDDDHSKPDPGDERADSGTDTAERPAAREGPDPG
jgi:hypothetical protein